MSTEAESKLPLIVGGIVLVGGVGFILYRLFVGGLKSFVHVNLNSNVYGNSTAGTNFTWVPAGKQHQSRDPPEPHVYVDYSKQVDSKAWQNNKHKNKKRPRA